MPRSARGTQAGQAVHPLSLFPVTGSSGGGRQEEMATFCITEEWRLGANPNSLRLSGVVQAAQLGSVLASPPRRLESVQLTEFGCTHMYKRITTPTESE